MSERDWDTGPRIIDYSSDRSGGDLCRAIERDGQVICQLLLQRSLPHPEVDHPPEVVYEVVHEWQTSIKGARALFNDLQKILDGRPIET